MSADRGEKQPKKSRPGKDRKARARRGEKEKDPLSGFKRRPDLIQRQVGFDVVLYDPATEQVHMLNAVAGTVWHHITPDRSFKNVVEAIQLGFSIINPWDIRDDIAEFVEHLKKERLILPEDAAPPKSKPKRVTFGIPDVEITNLAEGYIRPELKTFSLPELEKRFELTHDAPVPFSDLVTQDPTAAQGR